MQIDISEDLRKKIKLVCKKSGKNEIGGILFGEHIGTDHFRVVDITIDNRGLIATFKRSLQHALNSCKSFFSKTNNNYERFNYLGEWHSHPMYAVMPSGRDNASMMDIVCDPEVGANFAVLIIVRLDDDELVMGGWSYFPNDVRRDVHISITE